MDTTQLRYFVAVVDCQSFSKAANRCHTSQPNLSEQVRNLEDVLGTTLLDRSGRQIVATETGRLLCDRARLILSQIDETKKVVRSIAMPGAERVSIGVMTTVASRFLVRVLDSFVKLHPKTQLDIHENITSELLPMIERGSLDLGIMGLPLRRKGFTTEILFSEEILLALHPKHPLAQKRTIFKEDLMSEKLILSQAGLSICGCPFRFCKHHKFSPSVVFRSAQLDTIQSLVAAGNGISLIPQTAIVETTAPITFRNVEDSELRRSIAAVTKNKRMLKKPATDFLRHLRTVGHNFKFPMAKGENTMTVLNGTKN